MKALLLIFLFPFASTYGQTKKPTPAKVAVAMTPVDSLSYSIGVQVARYYKSQGVEKINTEYVQKAFSDVFNDKSLTISEDECNITIQQKLQEFMANKINVAKEEGAKFLEENKKRPGVITLPDGLQYEIIIKGDGPTPTAGDTVSINYKGTLINGQEFDNSYKRGEPIVYPVSRFVRGWTEALQMMPVGSKWKLYVPSDLGYGDQGAGSAIPGGSTLLFELELLSIVHQ